MTIDERYDGLCEQILNAVSRGYRVTFEERQEDQREPSVDLNIYYKPLRLNSQFIVTYRQLILMRVGAECFLSEQFRRMISNLDSERGVHK